MGSRGNSLSTLAVNMIAFLLLSLVFASTSAHFSCEECKAFVDKLNGFYLSEESLQEQLDFLVLNICPTDPEPQLCQDQFTARWSDMATIGFHVFAESSYVCGRLNFCPQLLGIQVPSCPECVDLVNLIADDAEKEETLLGIIQYLQGAAYCEGEEGQVDECKEFVGIMLPLAIPALAEGYFRIRAATLCSELSGYC